LELKEDNILIHKEKPYYTDQELITYYQIMIEEAEKQKNERVAGHYKILLDYIKNQKEEENELTNFLLHKKVK